MGHQMQGGNEKNVIFDQYLALSQKPVSMTLSDL